MTGFSTMRRNASFRRGMTTAAIGALLVLPVASVTASVSKIGRTWPIAEPDALDEIQARASKLPSDMSAAFGPREKWSALRSAPLAVATMARTRTVVPLYTLQQDIPLPDGRILYHAGMRFNPLDYVTLPFRLLIVQPRDIEWALQEAAPADYILLSGGDPIEIGNRYNRAIFILEPQVKERFGLVAAPAIVRQVGKAMEVREFALKRDSDGRPILPAASAGKPAA